jgi:hypothetical protein
MCTSCYPFFVASLIVLQWNINGKLYLEIILKNCLEFCIEMFPGTAMEFKERNGNANEDISVASKAP